MLFRSRVNQNLFFPLVKSESKLSTSGNINFSDVYPLMPNMLNVFSVFTCTRVHAGRGMCSFIEFLYSSIPRSEGDDTLTWKFTKTGCLMFALTISCCLALSLRFFLGSVFGVQRCLNGYLSFYGRQLGMGYSLLII